MKKSLAVIGLLFSQLSFSQNLHNEQACVEHYLISHLEIHRHLQYRGWKESKTLFG